MSPPNPDEPNQARPMYRILPEYEKGTAEYQSRAAQPATNKYVILTEYKGNSGERARD